jgi:hypothetical protein
MSFEVGRHQSEADEVSQKVACGRSACPARLAALVECQASFFFQDVHQVLFPLGECHERTFLFLGLLPYFQVYKGSQDVFIVDADVSLGLVFFIQGTDGFDGSFVNYDFQYRLSSNYVSDSFYFDIGLAIHVGSSLNHVDFFFRPYSGYFSVVLYAYQQSSSFGVGKGRDATGDFSGIRNLKFEVLVVVFAFCHQLVYILGIC